MRVCVDTGHSMADTLTVALRVAEEAIEEAITKAESYKDSLVRNSCTHHPITIILHSDIQIFTHQSDIYAYIHLFF